MQNNAIEKLEGGLIVSCQATEGDPFDRPEHLALMAEAAALGGARGIRASRPDNVRAIRARVSLPIIAINKEYHKGFDVYITPTFESAARVVEAGGDIVALDATPRPRPGGVTLEALIRQIRHKLGVPVMADVSTLEEGKSAEAAGADLLATTLSGYTPYSRSLPGPDLELLDELKASCKTPVIVEGRIWQPSQVEEAFRRGAYAVVIGTAITNPTKITERFVAAIPDAT